MLKPITLVLLCLLVALPISMPVNAHAEQKASDFFKSLSREKNLLNALYRKDRKSRESEEPFTLVGEAGLLVTTGNTDTSIIKVALESDHELESWSNRYEAQILQRDRRIERNDEVTIEDTFRGQVSAQLDYKLLDPTKRLFAYLEYDDNQFNRLRDQRTVVLGWSQVAWKEDKSELRYSIGPGYSYFVQERNDRTIEEMIVRGTLFYDKEFSDTAQFRQVISAEVGEEISKARSQSSITAKVFEKFAMKLTVNLVFNNSVAEQDSELSTQTSISMVYQFF